VISTLVRTLFVLPILFLFQEPSMSASKPGPAAKAASVSKEPHAVLAVYRLKPNVTREAALSLLRDHARVLLEEKLRTPREPWILESEKDSRVLVEVFEWVDATAADRAHSNPAIQTMWGRFGALTDEIGLPPSSLPEAKEHFPHFFSLRP
jgi:hypothetical protein